MVRHLEYCVPFKNGVSPSKRQRKENITFYNSVNHDNFSYKQDENNTPNNDDESKLSSIETDIEINNFNFNKHETLTSVNAPGADTNNDQEIESNMGRMGTYTLTDKQHEFEIDVLKFCKKIDAPLYAYDELMKLLDKHKVLNSIIPGSINSRSSLINSVKNKHPFLKKTEPMIKNVILEDGSKIEVVTFDFLGMLTSLLNDKKCMKDENLTFPGNSPYSHPRETGERNEFHSGQWYQDIWKKRWKNRGDFVLGIIFFIDKTFTDVYGRLNLLPVQFTLTMFNQRTRAQYHAWRPLGYINDLKTINDLDTTEIPTRLKSERNLRNFHAILKVILQSLGTVQRKGRIKFNMEYRGVTYYLNLIPIVGPIIGDSEEHDVLVGRYGSYTRVQRICRYCDCHFDDSDNPYYEYTYTKQKDIMSIVLNNTEEEGRDILKKISYHNIRNAFNDLDLGDEDRGLHGLCPAEILHCVRLGLFKMAVSCFFKLFQPSIKKYMDKLLNVLSNQFSHQSDRDVPRTSFSFVISDLTKITAGEWTGIILLLTTALLTNAGHYICRLASIDDLTRNQYIKLFDRLLILEKWLQSTEGYTVVDLENLKTKLLEFLVNYKKICKRQEGNEMKILKYHMMTHLVDDILRLGAPQNVNGGPCESNFIPQKREAKRTQRRADTFIGQIASRIHENLIFSHAVGENQSCEDDGDKKVGDNIPVGGRRYWIELNSDSQEPEIKWKRQKSEQQTYDQSIVDFVFREMSLGEEDTIQCFTEHKVNGRIFRADSSYRGKESWYDWVTVVWQKENGSQVHMLARLHMFLDCSTKRYETERLVSGISVEGGQIYAVISSIREEYPSPKGVSKLFLRGTIYKERNSDIYYVVSVDTIDANAFVVYDVLEEDLRLDKDTVLIMKPCETWKDGISIIDNF